METNILVETLEKRIALLENDKKANENSRKELFLKIYSLLDDDYEVDEEDSDDLKQHLDGKHLLGFIKERLLEKEAEIKDLERENRDFEDDIYEKDDEIKDLEREIESLEEEIEESKKIYNITSISDEFKWEILKQAYDKYSET